MNALKGLLFRAQIYAGWTRSVAVVQIASVLHLGSFSRVLGRRKHRWELGSFTLLAHLFLAASAAAQCSGNLTISPASPTAGSPVTVSLMPVNVPPAVNLDMTLLLDASQFQACNNTQSNCVGTFNSPTAGDHTVGWTISYVGFPGVQCSGSQTVTLAPGQTVTAYINPKYRIIGVQYAPPGAASSVVYTGNTTIGHTTDISSSFSANVSESVSIGSTGGIFGFFKGGVTGTSTTSWTQGSSTDNTTTLTQGSSFSNTLGGPTNSFAGVDHDYDEILLWLNPVVPLSQPFPIITPIEPVTWNGYGFDLNDPTAPNDLDIQHIKVGWLNGDIPIPSDIASVLDRAWAGSQNFNWPSGQGPGLTGPGTDPNSDFGQILQADPFAWCTPISHGVIPQVPTGPGTTGPATCPTSVPIEPNSNRYTQVTNQPLNFTQAAVGANPNPNAFTQSTTTMTSNKTGSNHEFKQGFGIDITFTTGSDKLVGLTYDFKTSNTETWTDQTLKTLTNTTGNTAQVTITGPTCTVVNNVCSPQYTGPNLLTLYQDNLYGTFMFLAGSSPNYILNVQPIPPVAIPVGGTATYTVSATPIDNYNGSITLSLATNPALPPGAQGTFNPTSITPGQSSTLSITTNANTTPAGSTTFLVNASGASGTGGPPIVNNTTAPLVVEDFQLAVTPTANTVQGGQSAGYQVTVTPLPFSSSPGLDVSAFTVAATSLPPFTTQVQGPNSPSGVDNGFTTTLTINTDVGGITPGGTFMLPLKATVGAISHTQNVDLTDNAPDFTIAASPPSVTIARRGTATYTTTIGALNGFTGNVTLSSTGTPANTTATFTPPSVTGSGTSTLKITSKNSTPTGTFTVTIKGTSGTVSHSTTVTLIVQ